MTVVIVNYNMMYR